MSWRDHKAGGTGIPPFAGTREEAERRFERWRSTDPYRDVAPALLNSADLLDYVATVGMLHPYEVTVANRHDWVKPASCAVGCTGEFLRYELDAEKPEVKEAPVTGIVAPDTRLRLPPNSITFLHLGTTFRIPDYIAARFNLAIREIHRGILVGTGPLVDPGFVGRLLIPLHNLTSNEYTVAYGEPLVWVEFTKLSPTDAWTKHAPQRRRAAFVAFPPKKLKRNTPALYLDHANEGRPIASSIPKEIALATSEARQAAHSVTTLRRGVTIGTVVAVLGLVGAGIWPIASLISDTNSRVDQSSGDVGRVQSDVSVLQSTEKRDAALLASLRREIARLRGQIATQQRP